MWRNWAGDQACEPAVVERPATARAVAEAVGRAAAAGRRVRVAGTGHSFTPGVLTDGALVRLDRMTGIVEADRASGRVRVRAGTTIRELNDALAGLGLALENLGDIDAQTIAGALATGTHGTGAGLPGLAGQVEAVQLVTASGDAVELDGSDPVALRAARVSLGALGVVTEVTLRCVPAFTLRGTDATVRLEAVLAELDERIAGHRHFELFTFPHSPLALTRTNDAVDAAPEPRSAARSYVDDVVLGNRAFEALCLLGRRVPRAIPRLNRLAARVAGTGVRVDRSDRIFASPRLVRFTEM
jgi:FAD/FMN-containing dehydrogenase